MRNRGSCGRSAAARYGGKLVRVRVFRDRDEALEAAGLRE